MNQIPLAERIRAERCRDGYTQEELARRLGVTKAAVSKWECGQSAPTSPCCLSLPRCSPLRWTSCWVFEMNRQVVAGVLGALPQLSVVDHGIVHHAQPAVEPGGDASY